MATTYQPRDIQALKMKREALAAEQDMLKYGTPTFRESNGVIAPASNGSYTTLEDAGFYGDDRFKTPTVGQKGNPYVTKLNPPGTTGTTTSATTTGDPEVDAFTQQLMNQLNPLDSQLTSLYGDLDSAKGRAESQLLMDLQNQKALYDQLYAPRFDEAMAGTERSKDASNLSAAFSGSVRGSRQEERLQDLETQGNKMLAALEAEKMAQLRLDEAVLRGANDLEVQSLQDQIAGIQTQKSAIESTIRLAEENLLAEQYSIAADREKAQADALKDLGYVMNPLTGELEETLVAQEKYAQILNTNAETAKLVDAVTNKKMDIYDVRADENGNSTAVLFDPYTGEVTTINLGKLDPARAAALTGYRGSGGGSGGSGGSYSASGIANPWVQYAMDNGLTADQVLELMPSDKTTRNQFIADWNAQSGLNLEQEGINAGANAEALMNAKIATIQALNTGQMRLTDVPAGVLSPTEIDAYRINQGQDPGIVAGERMFKDIVNPSVWGQNVKKGTGAIGNVLSALFK